MKTPHPIQRLRHRRAAKANGARLAAICAEIDRRAETDRVIDVAALEASREEVHSG